jgi:hypothetical protein
MSICKICAANGYPNIEITWSEKIKSSKTGRLIPLETDNATFHKHYEPTTTTNESAIAKTTTTERQVEDAALEALTLEFKSLLKHISEYLKANKNG